MRLKRSCRHSNVSVATQQDQNIASQALALQASPAPPAPSAVLPVAGTPAALTHKQRRALQRAEDLRSRNSQPAAATTAIATVETVVELGGGGGHSAAADARSTSQAAQGAGAGNEGQGRRDGPWRHFGGRGGGGSPAARGGK
jgi:hypothetical protein